LPHYIAARFDLAIEFIYQGILLGTGPQVDPGFQGYLSCPLHNISSAAVHIQMGQAFAKMDFAKTSGLRLVDECAVSDEDALYVRAREDALPGLDGNPVRLFKNEKRWRTPIVHPGYAGGKTVASSVKRLEDRVVANRDDVDEFGNEIRRLRRFGLASGLAVFLAIIGLLLSLAQLDRNYIDAKVNNRADQVSPSQVRQLETSLHETKVRLAKLEARVTAIAERARGQRK
jgi:hypothetical protein